MEIIFLVLFFLFLLERTVKFLLVVAFFKKTIPKPFIRKTSVIQAILSGDPTLWKCLSENVNFKTNLEVEYLWLVDENDQNGIEGCQKIIGENEAKAIQLIITPLPADGVNPKTFKLLKGLEKASGEIIAVLDDDTILPDFGLDTAIRFLQNEKAGIAFGLPYYINFSNLWSSLVSCFVNSQNLYTYIPYTFFSQPITINGMFYVLKKTIFQEVLPDSGFENKLTDDYAIAQLVKKKGYQLIQTPVCHGISTQVINGKQYINLLKRWFVFPQVSMMKSENGRELWVFLLFAFLPTLFPLFLILFSVALFLPGFIFLSLFYLIFNTFILLFFNHAFLKRATPVKYYMGLVLQTVLLPFYILWSLVSPKKINWRGHVMQIDEKGSFTFVQRRND